MTKADPVALNAGIRKIGWPDGYGGKNDAKDYRNGGALAGLGRVRNVTYAGF